jgi:hypothetical protein
VPRWAARRRPAGGVLACQLGVSDSASDSAARGDRDSALVPRSHGARLVAPRPRPGGAFKLRYITTSYAAMIITVTVLVWRFQVILLGLGSSNKSRYRDHRDWARAAPGHQRREPYDVRVRVGHWHALPLGF